LFQTNPWKLHAARRAGAELTPRRLVVVDEADRLEGFLDSLRRHEYPLADVDYWAGRAPVVEDRSGWAAVFHKIADAQPSTAKSHRRAAPYRRAAARCLDEDWVIELGADRVSLRQVSSDRFAHQVLWPWGDKFLLMSATIGTGDLLMERLGVGP